MYSEAERRIFWADAGGSRRAFDPLLIQRRLAEAQRTLGLDLRGLLESYQAIDEASRAAGGDLPGSLADEQFSIMDRIGQLSCSAFDVPPLAPDGSGWTQEEAVLAIADYLKWEAALAGERGASPSASTSTGGPPGDSAAGQTPSTIGPTSG